MNDDPYRFIAGCYDRLFEPLNRGLQSLGARMTGPAAGMRVLDVGCGTGSQLAHYRESGCELHGIDSSAAMLAVARRRLGEGAMLLAGDAAWMPYADDSFDLVLCMLVLHELDPPVRIRVLTEVRRVLRPGGCVLLIDYHAGPARPLKGWLLRPVIYLAERAAGQRHFRNYRQFMAVGGLPEIFPATHLLEEQRKVVAGNLLALHLLRQEY